VLTKIVDSILLKLLNFKSLVACVIITVVALCVDTTFVDPGVSCKAVSRFQFGRRIVLDCTESRGDSVRTPVYTDLYCSCKQMNSPRLGLQCGINIDQIDESRGFRG